MKLDFNNETFFISQRDYTGHFHSSEDVDLYDIDIRIDARFEDSLNKEKAFGNTQTNCCVTYVSNCHCATIRC